MPYRGRYHGGSQPKVLESMACARYTGNSFTLAATSDSTGNCTGTWAGNLGGNPGGGGGGDLGERMRCEKMCQRWRAKFEDVCVVFFLCVFWLGGELEKGIWRTATLLLFFGADGKTIRSICSILGSWHMPYLCVRHVFGIADIALIYCASIYVRWMLYMYV